MHELGHSSIYLIVITLLTLTLLFVLSPRQKSYITSCKDLTTKLPPHRLDEIAGFFQDDDQPSDADFWTRSKGLRGIRDRGCAMAVLVMLLQVHRRDGRLSRQQARRVLHKAGAQYLFSILAIPEAMLCVAWKEIPHVCALTAARFHYEASTRTYMLCNIMGAPECVHNGGMLL